MEYGNRKLLKSDPAPEPTAFTMRSIHDILAESGNEGLLNPSAPPKVQSAASAPIQAPPSARALAHREPAPAPVAAPAKDTAKAAAEAAARARAALAADVPAATSEPQSFGQRLASKIFGRK